MYEKELDARLHDFLYNCIVLCRLTGHSDCINCDHVKKWSREEELDNSQIAILTTDDEDDNKEEEEEEEMEMD